MTTKGSSTKPKNIKECVYVLQDVAQNLSNCVQNLNSKRTDPNKCDLNQDNNQTKMYRTMMNPQDWDNLLKKDKKMKNSSGRQDNFMDNTYENDFKNLSNQLASTRKPIPFDFDDCTNNPYMNYSSNYDNMLKKSRSATAMHVGLNAVQMTGYDRNSPPYTNSYLNSQQQQQQQYNKSSKAKCPVDNRTMVYQKNPLCDPCGRICQPKKPPSPPMYQSTPYKSSNPYGNYETSTNYNAVDSNYYSNSKTYASNQYPSDSKSYNNNNNNNCSNPYLELEDLIVEIEDILQKTKNCAGQKANHDKQKCGHKEHNSKCQCCCKKKEKKKSEDSSVGVNYLICKFDKFVANQKTQIQQFENMIECLKNSDFSKQSEFGSETSCKEDTINNLWAERLNEIIDIIIEGFGNVIKTMVQVNDSTGKEDDCVPEDKEATMNNKLKALQLNIIEILQNIIDTLEKCVETNETDGIKAGQETKGNESKRSSKISIPESKVETEIVGNQGIISDGANIQLDE